MLLCDLSSTANQFIFLGQCRGAAFASAYDLGYRPHWRWKAIDSVTCTESNHFVYLDMFCNTHKFCAIKLFEDYNSCIGKHLLRVIDLSIHHNNR